MSKNYIKNFIRRIIQNLIDTENFQLLEKLNIRVLIKELDINLIYMSPNHAKLDKNLREDKIARSIILTKNKLCFMIDKKIYLLTNVYLEKSTDDEFFLLKFSFTCVFGGCLNGKKI